MFKLRNGNPSLLAGGLATVGTLIGLFMYGPDVSGQYSIARPNGDFFTTEGQCPSDAVRHYFTSKTSSGESLSINLCILANTFGKDNARLIPYMIDNDGMVWGAPSYSSEVSNYERTLEHRFKLPLSDEARMKKEKALKYRDQWVSGIGYLVGGLAIFAAVVWVIGWVVRGFLGIPRGMDMRAE